MTDSEKLDEILRLLKEWEPYIEQAKKMMNGKLVRLMGGKNAGGIEKPKWL